MKPKNIAIIAAAILVVAVIIISPGKKVVFEGGEAPSFTVYDAGGKAVSLDDLKGKVVVVNFWATWCDPCRSEMPSIQYFYDMFKSHPKFAFVSILYNDDPEKADKLLKDRNYTFPYYLDKNSSASKDYGITGVPETYIIDSKGVLRKKVIGPMEFDSEPALKFVLDLLGG